MSNKIVSKHNVVVSEYEGGKNAVITSSNGKSVSVVKTDYGLYDVKEAGKDRPTYTGSDSDRAAEAVIKALRD